MSQSGNAGKRRGKHDSSESSASSEAPDERPFEEQLDELDAIVATLEEGKLPLDEALTLYERGMRLAQACQRRLDDAALRVSRLRAAANPSESGANGDAAFILESIEIDGV
ncbi:MAG TPA: exodeoxyribonuclease VII small subunit [Ktedonobacterales bacterium]|nr:exodeoxyribonuclease VII small subunit [Ktedonobacterales bacterium]